MAGGRGRRKIARAGNRRLSSGDPLVDRTRRRRRLVADDIGRAAVCRRGDRRFVAGVDQGERGRSRPRRRRRGPRSDRRRGRPDGWHGGGRRRARPRRGRGRGRRLPAHGRRAVSGPARTSGAAAGGLDGAREGRAGRPARAPCGRNARRRRRRQGPPPRPTAGSRIGGEPGQGQRLAAQGEDHLRELRITGSPLQHGDGFAAPRPRCPRSGRGTGPSR